MDTLTATLRALSDPTRRAIIDLLAASGLSVSELAQHFSVSRPAISKHLAALREAGLAVARRRGRQQFYELATEPLGEVREWLDRYRETGPRESRAGGPRPIRQPDRASQDVAEEGWRCW